MHERTSVSAFDLHVLFELRLRDLKQEIAGCEAALQQPGPAQGQAALAEQLCRARTIVSLLRYLRVYLKPDGSLGGEGEPEPA
jgi:hypothetical protein